MTKRVTRRHRPPGLRSMFRGKVRAPVSVTFTRRHHQKIRRNMRRLGITSRADFLALLIEKYADVVKLARRPAR
jgi:hypothetical protein